MSKRVERCLIQFNREWNKRFQLVREDGTPLEPPKEKPGETSPHEEEIPGQDPEEMDLTEEELEEMELMDEIGTLLDRIAEEPHEDL